MGIPAAAPEYEDRWFSFAAPSPDSIVVYGKYLRQEVVGVEIADRYVDGAPAGEWAFRWSELNVNEITEEQCESLSMRAIILVPISDTSDGSWQNQAGSTTNLFESLDQVSVNDSIYIKHPVGAAGNPAVFKLTSASDDLVGYRGHRLRARTITEETPETVTVELFQGNPTTSGVLKATLTAGPGGSPSPSNFSYSLTEAEIEAITDYTDLYLRIDAPAGLEQIVFVPQAYFMVPGVS